MNEKIADIDRIENEIFFKEKLFMLKPQNKWDTVPEFHSPPWTVVFLPKLLAPLPQSNLPHFQHDLSQNFDDNFTFNL